MSVSTVSDPQVSPDGSRVAYVLGRVDRQGVMRRRIGLCPIDGSNGKLLTPADGQAICPRWSPDGSRLAFANEAEPGWTITVLSPEGRGAARSLVVHRQRIDELEWSPGGHQIAYVTLFDPENPDERPRAADEAPRVRVTRRLDYKEDGRGYLGDRRKHVFVVDVIGGTSRRLTSDPIDHDSPQWLGEGRWIAMRVHLADRSGDRLLVLDLDEGEQDWVGGGRGPIVHWSASPDGERLLFAGDPDHTLYPDYFLHSRSAGVTRQVTSDLRSFPDCARPVWLDERHVLVHSFLAGASSLEILDCETGESETVERPHSRHAGLSVDPTGRRVVQVTTSLTSPSELRTLDRETGAATIITSHNRALMAAHPPAVTETFSVQNDGFAIDAWLLKPPDFDPQRRYPVILDVHGGPNANYGYGFIAHEQCLASNGFLVLYANPRGSTSYGREFARQVIRNWGEGDYEDLMAVLDYVLERPEADHERVGIFGISYGGYLTAWAIGQTTRFTAAVCGEPIFDLESDYGTSDVAFHGLEHYGGGPPHAEPAWYTTHSPSTFAHRTRTPTLILAGEEDHRCPIGQSEQMFVALKKAGCEVEFARYPGGTHMFFAEGVPAHRVDFLSRTLGWFKRHLGDPL